MILRPITNIEFVGTCRYTGYTDKSVRLTLKCGHERTQKASQKIGERARCRECERASLPSQNRAGKP